MGEDTGHPELMECQISAFPLPPTTSDAHGFLIMKRSLTKDKNNQWAELCNLAQPSSIPGTYGPLSTIRSHPLSMTQL